MKKLLFLLLAIFTFSPVFINAQPGTLDSDFDADGKMVIALGNSYDVANSVAVQPDGKILIAGYTTTTQPHEAFVLIRLNTDGSTDNSFGTDGVVTLEFNSSVNRAMSMALQPDGKIVLVGSTYSTLSDDIAIVRLTPDGQLDEEFSTDGFLTVDINGLADYPSSVVIQPDGKIVVSGFSYNGLDMDFLVMRYTPNGMLDGGFNVSGYVTTDFGSSLDYANAMAIQDDGKIVVAGYTYTNSSSSFIVVRYNTDGTLDNTFSIDGIVKTMVGSETNYAYALAIQPDGKIVLGGDSGDNVNEDFALTRYNSDGTLDLSFDEDGKVITHIGEGT